MTGRDDAEDNDGDDDPRDIDDAEDPIEALDPADEGTNEPDGEAADDDPADRLPGTEDASESPIEPLAETDADKERPSVDANDRPDMASSSDDSVDERGSEAADEEGRPDMGEEDHLDTGGDDYAETATTTTDEPVDERGPEAADEDHLDTGEEGHPDMGEEDHLDTGGDDYAETATTTTDEPVDEAAERDPSTEQSVRADPDDTAVDPSIDPAEPDIGDDRRDDRRRRRRSDREDRRRRRQSDREVRDRERRSDRRRRSDPDPLDVTESDLDTDNVDEEDLDRLAELLDEAREDPDRVRGRDFEDMLTVFDDAGIDTTDLDVEDLEERFDESLKVARILVTAAANTGEYAGLASIRAGSRMAEAAFTSESPRDLLEETTDIARNELDRLGFPFGSPGRDSSPERSERRSDRRPDRRFDRRDDDEERNGPLTVADLRRRGAHLLELSADVDHEEPFHPAYVRVLEQLSADEARILRLLATEGPQPALDVYDRGFLPFGSGTLVVDGLTMLDIDAGLRYAERSDVYLDNLERLGLLEVMDAPLRDLDQYRVLQAQPNVERAEERARRPAIERRSVRLTAMGVDLCRTVFPFEVADRYDDDDPAPGSDAD